MIFCEAMWLQWRVSCQLGAHFSKQIITSYSLLPDTWSSPLFPHWCSTTAAQATRRSSRPYMYNFISFNTLISPFSPLLYSFLMFWEPVIFVLPFPHCSSLFFSSFYLILEEWGLLLSIYLLRISPCYEYTTFEYRKLVLYCKNTT